MFKQVSVAVLGLGLIGTQACVAGGVDEELVEVGDVGQAVCASNNGVNETLAALAVAMAKNIKELHPVRDLKVEQTGNVVHNAIYTLRNVHANKCLDLTNGSGSNGANIRLWSCNNATAQQFRFEHAGNGYYQVRNMASSKCLDATGTSNGANVVQNSCNGADNQLFSVRHLGGSNVSLVSRNSAKALDGWAWGTGDGTNIAMWEAFGAANQTFTMTRTNGNSVGGGFSVVRLSDSGRSKCNSNGGCSNIDALLDLQDGAVNNVVDQALFNAANYRNTVVASYERQLNTEINLQNNNPGALPDPHRLEFSNQVNNGGCGMHYVFNAFKAGCWGSNCQMNDPQDIENRLAFFENGGNPFLAFYSSNGQIAIDPTGTMNGDTSTSSGSCTAASMVYDPTYKMNNKCCTVSGNYGVFKPSSFNKAVFLCDY